MFSLKIYFTAFALLAFLTVAANADNEPKVIALENHGVQLTINRLEHKRLTYTERDSKNWIFFSVENTERPGRGYYSTISQEGSIAILPQRKTLEELALKEKQLHERNYTSTKIEDFEGGSKALIYEDATENKLTERRVFLWWKEGQSIIKLDFIFRDFTSRARARKGRQFVIDTLTSLRVNGAPVPVVTKYLKILEEEPE